MNETNLIRAHIILCARALLSIETSPSRFFQGEPSELRWGGGRRLSALRTVCRTLPPGREVLTARNLVEVLTLAAREVHILWVEIIG